ncbi:acyltransferase [Verminephrobacter aporrectodeae subsp. tuberculatae]|uniref:LpxL/LpxP family acyltransferase n=1 Tax=Verminephrobacter aporrectodeae TaxID=1110389 RepID=UPI002238ECFA|nr:acyltransferase [Verminephrobacter aporrectodeae]MCW5220051.1 acyltransferase [Verminephrobacter aporrectodeae subsp. tuberculatae]MCW5289339.1 acyltransferase [Verminephrobacter aporrectodeae subsp. tuberculatae]
MQTASTPSESNAPPAPAPHWASLGERTFVAGIRLLFWIYRVLGRLPFRLCLYPVVAYYWATCGVARRSSLDYLQKLQAFQGSLGHAPGWRDSLRHFLAFAETILDKLLAIRGDTPANALRAEGEEGLLALHAKGRGAVIVTGHVGCMEMCRISAQRHRGVRLNVLVHTEHAERFNRILQRLQPDCAVRFIQVSEVNPATAMLLADKVAQGEYVAITGDRVPVRQSMVVSADFLGHPAQWPVGPYVLAALLKCPLYAMGCVRDDAAHGGGYVLRVHCLAEQVTLPRNARREALAAHARQFAAWLEGLLDHAPLAWLNFFPFWAQEAAPPRTPQADRDHAG